MILREFFDVLINDLIYVLVYLFIILVMAFVAGLMGQDKGYEVLWKYFYFMLIYFICVLGIFFIIVLVYQFLFEWCSIWDVDVFVQVLFIIFMVVILFIIWCNVNLDYILGFDKLGGLVMIIVFMFIIMWFIDWMWIIVFLYLCFEYVIFFFVGLLLVICFGWKWVFGSV